MSHTVRARPSMISFGNPLTKRSPAAAGCREPYIFDVDEYTFQQAVLDASSERLVMVDFWADWCPPCKALTPVLERLAHDFDGRFLLAKVEVDDNMRLAGHYKLRGFPTIILFWQGQQIEHFSGYKPVHTVRELVEDILARIRAPG